VAEVWEARNMYRLFGRENVFESGYFKDSE
jgi:hypothetical protein